MRAIEAVPESNGMAPQEVKRLRSVEVETIIVAGGVLDRSRHSTALTRELAAEVVRGRGAEREEVGCTARCPLQVIGNVVNGRIDWFVTQVIVAPRPRCVQKP